MFSNNSFLLIFTSFIISTISTILVTPKVLSLGSRLKIIDQPSARKQHKKPIVHIGGIAIIIGFYFSLFISYLLGGFKFSGPDHLFILLICIISSLIFFVIGFLDDVLGLSPIFRLALQFGIACGDWFMGLRIESIDLSFISSSSLITSLPPFLSLLITIFWLVGITNSINWIDGLDGLAAGISAISCIGLIPLYFYFENNFSGLLAASMAGSCVGFLRYNFYPSKILMGDGGSYFLGYNLAALSIIGYTTPTINIESNGIDVLKLYLPVLILFIPLLDMLKVITMRIYNGYSPFYPDRNHLHHWLLNNGNSHKQSVLIIFSISQFFVLLSLSIGPVQLDPKWLIISAFIMIAVSLKDKLKSI